MTDFVSMCARGDEEGVREALGRGVDPNTRNEREASKTCQIGIVRRILAIPGVDVEAREARGWTPVMVAMRYGSKEVVRAIVEVVDLDTRDKQGRSLEDMIYRIYMIYKIAVLNASNQIVSLFFNFSK